MKNGVLLHAIPGAHIIKNTIAKANVTGRYFIHCNTFLLIYVLPVPFLNLLYHTFIYKSSKDTSFFSLYRQCVALKLYIFLYSSYKSHHFPKYILEISDSEYPISNPTIMIHAKFIFSGSASSSDSAWLKCFFFQNTS